VRTMQQQLEETKAKSEQ